MNPATFELHEQHMAPPFESKNRLKDHPKGRDLFLPVTEGTVAIAAHLGVLSKHPCVDDPDCRDAAGEIGRLAAPYIGDLLLFLEDSEGPYCVDWDVKAMQGDHGRPGAGDWTERTSPKRIRAATCREEIYQECSRQLGIRVVRVAKEDLPRQLRYNLDSLFRLHHQTIDLSADRQDELVAQFQEALISECPPQTVIERYRSLGTPGMKDCKRVLEQAIWNRRIRIDLYSPWGIDWPLLPEVRDPLVEFSHWFSR
ncbi:hypothetical protein [Variovorax sp. dw_308]|uniref:hypothetical protein n=1 Tax=Variovorax sp. dw_308 TaxID=2721546 RepID=UPI001C472E90|nr:hypothetical protein [Variovorax sp. dw_308]